MTPFFIICRNRVTWLKSLIGWAESLPGVGEIFLLDSASTYQPLLDFYAETEHTVLRSTANDGHKIGWTRGYLTEYAKGGRFVLTDHDLYPTEDCPDDILIKMNHILDVSPHLLKVGASLPIHDLPDHYERKQEVIAGHTAQGFWSANNYDKVLNVFKNVGTDTTMAMYQPHGAKQHGYGPSYRLAPPYTLRHLPWYLDLDNLSEEEAYYHATASPKISNWCRKLQDPPDDPPSIPHDPFQ